MNSAGVRDVDPLHTVESQHITLQSSLHICDFTSIDSTNHKSCSSGVLIEKKSTYKWTHAVRTCVVQASIVCMCISLSLSLSVYTHTHTHTSIYVLSCSVMSDSVIPWTVTHQALLSRRFSRQEYWNGLPFPPPGDWFSRPRNQTHISCISCIGRQILYHLTHQGNPYLYL